MLPFENRTPEPTLTQDVNEAVRAAVEERLGLRQEGEETADALVRGSITRYEPDVPVAYAGNDLNRRVDVTRRLVQITVTVEIVNQRTSRTIWQRSGLMVEGDYEPDNETEQEGREEALERLTVNIVEGAQSQW